MTEDTARSPQLLRRMNSDAILRFALATDVFTAADAMHRTGLTRATVLGVCADLVGVGWLEEAGDSAGTNGSRGGRPARRYALRLGAGVIVGLDAAERRFAAVVSDLRGARLAEVSRDIDPLEVTGASRRGVLLELRDDALAAAGCTPDDVLVSVVGVPAPVDSQGHSLSTGDYWPTVNPGFGDSLGGMVVVENDANLAAMAEDAHRDGEGSATLLMNQNVGAGIILDGNLLRGPRGAAGEMRFLSVLGGPGPAIEEGPADGLLALTRLWIRALAPTAGRSRLSGLGDDELTGAALVTAVQLGDELALMVLERLADRLARIVIVLGSVLDLDRVVVAGPVSVWAGPVVDRCRELLEGEGVARPVPDLVLSELGSDAVTRGAIARALAAIREDPSAFAPRSPGRTVPEELSMGAGLRRTRGAWATAPSGSARPVGLP